MSLPVKLAVTAMVAAAAALSATPAAQAREGGLSIKVHGAAARKGPIPAKAPAGQPDAVGIVGEAAGETEFRLVDEIADAVASGQEGGPNGEVALRVMALPGRGGLQNVRDVLARPDIDFGIAPALVLERAAATPEMANLRDRIAYVAPLYVEEVHLLARPGISAVADLAGKRVSLGEEGGATEAVGRAALDALGIGVDVVNLDPRESVSAVREGRVDAAFVVSGKPVGNLRGAGDGGKVHLVPFPSDRVPDGFLPSVLTHDDYPGLIPEGGKVETLGVQNVLFGYDWPVRSARGRVGKTFLSILLWRLPDLQVGRRHPKWREINVAATMPGWKRLPAMQEWLTKAKPRAVGSATEAEFEAFLRRTGTSASGETRDALYQDFLRWRGAPVALGSR